MPVVFASWLTEVGPFMFVVAPFYLTDELWRLTKTRSCNYSLPKSKLSILVGPGFPKVADKVSGLSLQQCVLLLERYELVVLCRSF